MPARAAVPEAFLARPFTTAEWRAAGLPRGRLESAAFTSATRGVHVPAGLALGSWEEAASIAELTGGVLSHVSAARLHGIPLPGRLAADGTLHLTFDRRERHGTRSRLPRVTAHRVRLPPADVVVPVPGRPPVTTPERTWLDLAAVLRANELRHLVAAGDHLVTPPWDGRGKVLPATTRERIAALLDVRAGRHGVRLARVALDRVRVGAHSPQETFVRLALVDAGFGEPALQFQLDPSDPDCTPVDLALPRLRTVIQYDGITHRTAEQQASDARRDRWYTERSWRVIRLTWMDSREEFRGLIATLRRREAQEPDQQSGWR